MKNILNLFDFGFYFIFSNEVFFGFYNKFFLI